MHRLLEWHVHGVLRVRLSIWLVKSGWMWLMGLMVVVCTGVSEQVEACEAHALQLDLQQGDPCSADLSAKCMQQRRANCH